MKSRVHLERASEAERFGALAIRRFRPKRRPTAEKARPDVDAAGTHVSEHDVLTSSERRAKLWDEL